MARPHHEGLDPEYGHDEWLAPTPSPAKANSADEANTAMDYSVLAACRLPL